MIVSKVKTAFAETRIDGEIVLMNIDTGSLFALKATGLAIWDLIGDANDRASIIASLAAKYPVAPDQCEKEVDAFLIEIEKAGFVTLE